MSVMREYHESLQEILELLGIDEGAYAPDELDRAATSEIANTLIDRVPIADLHELLDGYKKEN